MRVLITSANSRMAYVMSKALLEAGIDVVVADFMPGSFSFYSRYIREKFVYPNPFSNESAFVACLIEKLKEQACDVLIPVQEETFVVAKHASALREVVNLALPRYDQILETHNKDRLVARCRKLDVPVPRTGFIHCEQDYDRICDEFEFPLILKPRQGGGNFGIEYVYRKDHFKQTYTECLSRYSLTPERILIQEYIKAKGKFSQAYVYDRGRMIASFTDSHIRDYPSTGGAGTFRVSTAHEEIAQLGEAILDDIGWHGVAECEFITDEKNEAPFMIEINPRIWGGVNSAIASDLNIPMILANIAMGNNEVKAFYDYKKGIQTRWFWADFLGFWDYYQAAPNKMRFVFDFFNLFSRSTVFDDFSIRDPLPFFVWPINKFMKIFRQRTLHPDNAGIEGEWS